MPNVLAGELLRSSSPAYTIASTPTDPTTLLVTVRRAGAVAETYVQGVDSEVVKDSTGHFHIDVPSTTPGWLWVIWQAAGNIVDVDEQHWTIRQTRGIVPVYATIEDLKKWIESEYNADAVDASKIDDGLLLDCLESATQDIDLATGRTFYPVTESRYYGSLTGANLVIHDITDVDEIATDPTGAGSYSVVWNPADYLLDPPNALADQRAYTRIRQARGLSFPIAMRGTRVTGTWGLTVGGMPPALIKSACLIGAHRWLSRRGSPTGTETVSDGMGGNVQKQIKADYDYDRAINRYSRTDTVDIVLPSITPVRSSVFRLARGYRGR